MKIRSGRERGESISPTFYKQLFHIKLLCVTFKCLQFGFVIFLGKENVGEIGQGTNLGGVELVKNGREGSGEIWSVSDLADASLDAPLSYLF